MAVTDRQESIVRRFLNKACSVATSKEKKAFKDDLETWVSSLEEKEFSEFCKRIERFSKDKLLMMGRDMYKNFQLREAV